MQVKVDAAVGQYTAIQKDLGKWQQEGDKRCNPLDLRITQVDRELDTSLSGLSEKTDSTTTTNDNSRTKLFSVENGLTALETEIGRIQDALDSKATLRITDLLNTRISHARTTAKTELADLSAHHQSLSHTHAATLSSLQRLESSCTSQRESTNQRLESLDKDLSLANTTISSTSTSCEQLATRFDNATSGISRLENDTNAATLAIDAYKLKVEALQTTYNTVSKTLESEIAATASVATLATSKVAELEHTRTGVKAEEGKRVAEETRRVEAETARKGQEGARVSKEKERVAKEGSRVTAEQRRVDKDGCRGEKPRPLGKGRG